MRLKISSNDSSKKYGKYLILLHKLVLVLPGNVFNAT